MRRIAILFVILLTACSVFGPPAITPSAGLPTSTPAPTLTSTWTPSPVPPSPTTTQTAPPTLEPTDTPVPIAGISHDFAVQVHPEDGLYVGDQVSFEVIPPPNVNVENHSVQVSLDGQSGKTLGSANFQPFGLGNRSQATLLWIWDTSNLTPGDYQLTFSVLPAGSSWTETLTLQPASALPAQYQGAHWETAKSSCCELHYISGTAAERDLESLKSEADAQAQDAVQKFNIGFTEPISVTLVPRVLGQGGFASNEINISYLDRNYGGSNFELVLHHEMIHILDARLGGDLRPSMFVEGLAVYLTGGHFKKVDVLTHAAALYLIHEAPYNQGDLGWLISLKELADNFYNSQHEIGYMEAAGLIKYMVQKYSWNAFNQFYRDIHPQEGGSQAGAINLALQKHFGINLDQLQEQFTNALRSQSLTANTVEDMLLTVRYFDTMRLYQKLLDPSAYFATAWLLDDSQMRSRGIVADYLRHPETPDNLALETLLVQADKSLLNSDYPETQGVVKSANAVLEAMEQHQPDPFRADPQAGDYYDITLALLAASYQPQQILLNGEAALAEVTQPPGVQLIELTLQNLGGIWLILH